MLVRRPLGAVLFLLFCSSFVVAQSTINVPADQTTIQGAINAAQNGDTVLVAPGTYFENLDYLGKTITVKSSGGAQVTIIDGSGSAPVVKFDRHQTAATVLDGFTIRHGFEQYGQGAGIQIFSSSPTIQNNVITENQGCTTYAVYVASGSPLIKNNAISNNGQMAGGCSGDAGGISAGGAPWDNGQVQIIGNTITGNRAYSGSAAGIELSATANAIVRGNLVKGNSAYHTAGMTVANGGQETIVGNVFTENISQTGMVGSDLEITTPTAALGPHVVSNTFVMAPLQKGASVYLYGKAFLANNLIISSGTDAALYCYPASSSFVGYFNNNDVYAAGNATAIDGNCAAQSGINGNVSFDPLFLDQAHDNFQLQARSSAIDAGDNASASSLTIDFEGNPRLLDGNGDSNAVIDLGAYEFVPGSAPSPYAALSPASFDFGLTRLGTTSAATSFRLTNTGTADMNIGSISANPPFALHTTDCPAILGAAEFCSISVNFSASSVGVSTGLLSVISDAKNETTSSLLKGSGSSNIPVLSPASIDFGSVLVTSAMMQNLVITNNGSVSITINDIALTGPFSKIAGGCSKGSVLGPGATCGMGIVFRPLQMGVADGSVAITTDATPLPAVATLTGTGVAPIISVSPSSLDFGNELLNTTSPVQTVTISNNGTAQLNFYNISIATGFAQTNNCGNYLPVGGSCTLSVTFTPTAKLTYSGNLSIANNSNMDATTTTIALSGAAAAPAISVNPTSASFDSQLIGTSAAKVITVTNSGTATLNIASVTLTGNFQQTNNCPASLNPNTSCMITVTYSPTVQGMDSGTITITHDASGSPTTVSVVGTAVAPTITVSANSISFSDQLVGRTSAVQTITVTNSGNAALSVTAISVPAPFTQTNNCGITVAAGASCSINVSFTPATRGPASANLSVVVAAPATSQNVSIAGSGVAPVVMLSPKNVTFSDQLVGTTSSVQSVMLSNTGDAPLALSSISLAAPFAQTNNCGASVAAGATCSISVTFSPTAPGAASSNLTVSVESPAMSGTVIVTGTAVSPAVILSPTSLTFPMQKVSTTTSKLVTLSNSGTAPLNISSIATNGAIVFTQTNDCPAVLNAGAQCSISVSFRPIQSGTYYGNLEVADDAPGSPQHILLTGTGTKPTASVSTTNLTFGITKVGTPSASSLVTLTNSGSVEMNVSSVTTSGDFAQSNNCGSSLAAGASCTIAITFVPSASGTRTGALTMNDDAGNGNPQTVSLTGTGAVATATVTPTSLNLSSIPVGGQSTASTVTFTNTSAVAMTIYGIAASGNFAQTNNCGTSLAAGASCTVNVSFVPAAAGTLTGQLTISSDAVPAAPVVSLSGAAVDFKVDISQASVSINAGQTASYDAKPSAVGAGYSTPIALTCLGGPLGSTCSLTPATLNAGQSSKVKIATIKGVTPSGSYVITVVGTSNGVSRSDTATLVIK